MNNLSMKNIAAIILAAGKGKRMNVKGQNKVALALAEKPIILRIVHFMKRLGIMVTVVVVGHAKSSVMKVLDGELVLFAEQRKRLGTGHALSVALKKLPEGIEHVFVVYGDDAVIYIDNHLPIMKSLFEKQLSSNAACTFLTIDMDNPFGLGRIVRDRNGEVLAIVEEKDATEDEKKITEINPGSFVFRVDFLKKYLSKVEKSPVTGEYYLTSLIDLAIKHGQKVETVKGGKLLWRGVNTPSELEEAEKMLLGVA